MSESFCLCLQAFSKPTVFWGTLCGSTTPKPCDLRKLLDLFGLVSSIKLG